LYADIALAPGFNVRKKFDNIDDLAGSIKKHGLLQPLVVREGAGDTKYFLVAGERRYRALGKLGITKVPVTVVAEGSRELAALNLIENLQRENLDPLEEAEGIQAYMDKYKVSQTEFADEFNLSVPYVNQRLSLLNKAAPEVKKAVQAGELTTTHARALVSLPQEQQKEVVAKIRKESKATGKMPSTAEVKDAADKLKVQNKKKKEKETGEQAPKRGRPKKDQHLEADAPLDALPYEGVEYELRNDEEIFEQLELLVERARRAKTPDAKQQLRAQVAALEWVLSIREAF
jgi:ParB family chromosome partitioning protein